MRLKREFYRQDAYTLARALLGKVLTVRGKSCRITETEAYGGATDKAAHSYGNRRTARTEVMFLDGGHVYVYFVYGMYYMLNIVASLPEIPEAVLIRAAFPLDEPAMGHLADGPGKLCRYLDISRSDNGIDLVTSDTMSLEDDGFIPKDIVVTKRIGIGYAEEDKDRLWRFCLPEFPHSTKIKE